MANKVRIPQPLQGLTNNVAEVEATGATIKDLIDDLERRYPGIKDRICDESGKVRRFVNLFVNEEDIRFLEREATKLKDKDEVSIIPAIAGGGKKWS
ncbi:MAG: hypothetical protein AMJ78_05005 [Omnitrophica WOR_2 bacterium SM23_29]|nr:MAG: hypothetical protein AMJ78_05005 [Omnitrophica WOR_2 bacterium SM23_29]